MAEGITFDPMGTVTVTIAEKSYVLGRPKLRQFRHHRDQIRNLSHTAMDKLVAMREKLEATDEEDPKYAKLATEVEEATHNAFLLTSVPWLKEVFSELGDPLPDDHDDWPAWLAADATIPSQIST